LGVRPIIDGAGLLSGIVKVVTAQFHARIRGVMRVVVEEQTHSLRREMVILGSVIMIGAISMLVLLVPELVH
jgi:hypothetical protein